MSLDIVDNLQAEHPERASRFPSAIVHLIPSQKFVEGSTFCEENPSYGGIGLWDGSAVLAEETVRPAPTA